MATFQPKPLTAIRHPSNPSVGAIGAPFKAPVPVATTGEGLTLDALMQRQKDIATRQASVQQQPVSSIPQGLAQLAWTAVDALQGRHAAKAEAEGRAHLAEIMGGINYDSGPTAQQIAEASQLDPAAGERLQELLVKVAEYKRDRANTLSDTAAANAEADRRSQRDHEQQVMDEKVKRGEVLSDAEQARKDELDKEGRASSAELDKEKRAAAEKQVEGQTITVTGDEAKKRGLDPTRTYKINTFTNEPDDITPNVVKQSHLMTKDEVQAEIGKGTPLDPTKAYKRDETGEVKPVESATLQLVPPEIGAKLGLGDEFLTNFDSIRSHAAAGDMTGPIDYQTTVGFGYGEGGAAYRQLRQGTEALTRLFTGAGMPASEVADRVKNYEPSFTDTADTLTSKLDGLKAAILAARTGATSGRNYPPPPDSGSGANAAGGLPAGVSEEDLAATMTATGLTREQVLAKLKERPNAGP